VHWVRGVRERPWTVGGREVGLDIFWLRVGWVGGRGKGSEDAGMVYGRAELDQRLVVGRIPRPFKVF
jgi:hypothetical protein